MYCKMVIIWDLTTVINTVSIDSSEAKAVEFTELKNVYTGCKLIHEI